MRRFKILILTVLTVASLFSLRDKEVVITVPDTKPLIAEAYHPSEELSPGLSPQQGQVSPIKNITSLLPSDNTDSGYYSSMPASVPMEGYISSASPPQSAPLQTGYTAPTTQTPAATNNQTILYGFGGFVDNGSGTTPLNEQAPTGNGGTNSAPVINSFVPPVSPEPTVDEGASLYFSINATDPDNDALAYLWKVGTDTVTDATSSSWTYMPEAGTANTAQTITAIVSDGSLTDEQAWTVNVTEAGTDIYISGITQGSGAQGADVVIQGVGFSTTDSNNIVKFGAAQSGTVDAVSQNQLHASVPAGLAAGYTDLSVTIGTKRSNNHTFDCLRDTANNVFKNKTPEMLGGLSIQDSSIVRLSDIDGDKDKDLVVVDRDGAKLYLLKNVLNGGVRTFTDVSAASLPAVTNAATVTDIKFGDTNRDGAQDILIINSQAQSARLLINNGTGVFTDATGANMPALSGNAVRCDLGDVDGDGSLDIIIAYKGARDALLLNNGQGVFTRKLSFTLPAVIDASSDIGFCDVDGDGDLDIITSNNEPADDDSLRNRIYTNDGSGNFTDDTDTTNRLPAGGRFTEILAIGDIKKDKAMDIVFADGLRNSVLINNGQGIFTDETLQRAPSGNVFSSVDAKLGDLNGDGNLDLAVLGENSLSLYMNDGTGVFDIDASIKLPDYTSSPAHVGGRDMELADIDGDGSLDIVIGGDSLLLFMSSAGNEAPVLTHIGNKQVAVGTNLSFIVTANDPNGDQVDILAENLPGNATFSNNMFSWTPALADLGNKSVHFTARERTQAQLEDFEDITIEVVGNLPPVLNVTPDNENDINLYYGESVVFAAYATDPDTPIAITWTVNGHAFSGTPSDFSILSVAFGSGTHTVVVTATDNTGASSSKTWTVNVYGFTTNHAPVIDSTTPSSPATIYVAPGDAVQQTFRITEYHDPDNPGAGQHLTFEWFRKQPDGSYAKIDEIGNASSAMLGLGLGRHFIKVRLTDDGSPSMSTSFVWDITVEETTSNHAPVIVSTTPSSPATIYVEPGGAVQQTFAVMEYYDPDNPGAGQHLTFEWFRKQPDGSYAKIDEIGNASSAMLGLGLGRHFIKVTLTDDGSPPASTYFMWDITVEESSANHPPILSDPDPPNTATIKMTVDDSQTFTVNGSDPDAGDTITTYSWTVGSSGAGTNSSSFTYDATQPGPVTISVTATDNHGAPSNTVTWNIEVEQNIINQVIQASFPYFYNETDNPNTGFVRDRVMVDLANKTSDPRFEMASMAATGFGLAALCVADNDPAVRGNLTTLDLKKRAALIMNKLLWIQGQQTADPEKWGRDGYFYHYVNINTGERWTETGYAAEVSTIDTAILVAGVLTAGEYFGDDDTDPDLRNIKQKALQIYKNVHWKAFLDTNPTVPNNHVAASPGYNQMYHAWKPENVAQTDPGFYGHWDYTSECLLLYLLAAAVPDVAPGEGYAIPPETFWAFRRELDKYGAEGNPMVKSWFGSLFVYQYTQAFFNFKDSNNKDGGPLYDLQGVDWWENSVEATKANKRFCNDNIGYFAGDADLWGLTSGYTQGPDTYFQYGAPPYGITPPPTDVHGADGTVFPSAPGGSIPFLQDECTRALEKMKELYDLYGYPVWGDYGFVSSFKLGASLDVTPDPIAEFYCGIDSGISLVMAQNKKSGLIWDKFSNFMVGDVTMRARITGLLGLTADNISNIKVDDVGPTSNFRMGKIDPQHTSHEIRFNMASKLNGPYLLAIHSFLETPGQTVTVGLKVNGTDLPDITFEYPEAGKEFHLMKYIDIDSLNLNAGQGAAGENTITLEWKSGTGDPRWLAWKNIELSSPVEHNTWSFARDEVVDPKILFGNEYRLDDTYYIGADVANFEQAVNKDVEKFTEILFYTAAAPVDYAALTLKALETQEDKMTNVEIYINGAQEPIFTGMLSTGQSGPSQIITTGFDLHNGWNRITIYHPGKTEMVEGEWIRWDRLSISQVERPGINPPKEFVAAPFGDDRIKMRWKADAQASSYKIYRAGNFIAEVQAPDRIYVDMGLDNNTAYHYVAKSVKLDGSESENSAEVSATTGSYRLDYGDGHEPNTFNGSTLDNGGTPIGDSAYIDGVKYNGIAGKVRKVALGAGMKNTITLNSTDISTATMLSFRVRSNTAGARFRITLWDNAAVPHYDTITLDCPTADLWQNVLYTLSSTFSTVDFTKIDRIEIASESAGPITLYFDEIDFNTVLLGSDYLDVKIRDRLTDGLATGLSFGTHSMGTQYVTAGQYIDIGYQVSGNWNIIIYTDNMAADASPRFGGIYDPNTSLVNGLIGVQNNGYLVPMVWQVFQEKKYTTGQDTPPWGDFYQTGYVVDKSDWNYNENQWSLPYRTILDHNADLGFPLDPVNENNHLKGDTTKRLYVYLGTNFEGAPAQDYTTNKLTIEIYHD